MPNPFRDDDDDAEKQAASGGDSSVSDSEGSSGGERDAEKDVQHPLFDSEPDETNEGGDTSDDLFVAEDDIPDTEKVTPEGVKEPLMKVSTFKKRIGKIIKQREDARKEAQSARQEQARAEGERDAAKDFVGQFREAYKENPDLATFDGKFMTTLEELSKTDASLAQLAHKVQEHMEGTGGVADPKGSTFSMADLKQASDEAQKGLSQETDSRLQAIIEGQARNLVRDSLKGVKPGFQEILADHIVNTSEKLEGLTTADVIRLSREYIAEKGIDKADVVAARQKPKDEGDSDADGGDKAGGKGGDKPATGAGSGKAAGPKGKGKEDGKDEDGHPVAKNLDEWEANRKKRTDRFLSTLDS
jgi:hypothetical protein